MQVAEITLHSGLTYQPIPFEEYKDIKAQRYDCEKRYQVIKDNYGDFKDKSLIDICCANGYFMFRFMQDGGLLARGIEIKVELIKFIHDLALEKKMNILCNNSLDGFENSYFDVGIYLDTHYATGTEGYLEYLFKHTQTLFTSCATQDASQQITDMNHEYKELLQGLFKSVSAIYTGFAGRTIFKCE